MYELAPTLAILRATPRTLTSLLRGLPDDLVRANYGPDTFSAFDVIGHLILGERLDWLPRTRHILAHGTTSAFPPFPWDGRDDETADATVAERLELFAALRGANLEAIESMDLAPADLERQGTHPRFGPVTLGCMLTTWGVHDVHHIAQVCKAVSFQFRHDLGPWRPHLNSLPPEPKAI